MSSATFPFEIIRDSAGHNVTGLTFDRPIPWPLFEGDLESRGLAHEVADVLDGGAEAKREHERAEALLGETENGCADLDSLTDPDGHLALAVAAAQEAYDGLRLLQGRFAVASQIISSAKPGPTAVREARAAALAALFDDATVSLLVAATQAASGVREHAQRGSNTVSTVAGNLRKVSEEQS